MTLQRTPAALNARDSVLTQLATVHTLRERARAELIDRLLLLDLIDNRIDRYLDHLARLTPRP